MAGGSNPQNVQAPQAGGIDQRRGPSIEDQPFRNPTFGFTAGGVGYNTPGGAEAAMRRQNAPATTPATSPAAGQPNIYQQSSNAYTQALQGTAAAGGMPNIAAFQNPYTRQVIDTSMADLERQRLMQQNQLGQQASAAGAFGGSRQGIAEAETNRAFAEQGGQLAAQLRQQGFNTALGAAQAQQGQQLASAGQLGNLSQQGFNMGQAIGNQQWQQGQAQQNINQNLINAIRGQYGGFTGSPTGGLNTYMGGLGGANMGQKTQTTTSNPGLIDWISAGAGLFCWVAREVYGPEDDRWMQFRAWMFGAAPDWLFNVYAKHGEAFAGIVRKVPVLKRALRPLMDRARRSAGFEV